LSLKIPSLIAPNANDSIYDKRVSLTVQDAPFSSGILYKPPNESEKPGFYNQLDQE
jgi:hypothetical protein